MMLWTLTLASALAGDFPVQVGALAVTGVQTVGGQGTGTLQSQVELDVWGGNPTVGFALDLDYHIDPYWFGGDNSEFTLSPHYPLPPEAAYIRLGRTTQAQIGVVNPNLGIQEWDEHLNYLGTFSNSWALTNGQIAGAQVVHPVGDTHIFAFGGYDMAWLAAGGGVGVYHEGDAFGTWTGLVYEPGWDYALLLSANEFYPADALWVVVELDAGMAGGGSFGGGQIIANVRPEAAVGGALRVDHQRMSPEAIDAMGAAVDRTAVTGSLRVDPNDWLHVALDAGLGVPEGGDAHGKVALLVAAYR